MPNWVSNSVRVTGSRGTPGGVPRDGVSVPHACVQYPLR